MTSGPSISLRIDLPNGGRLGPGKIALLEQIAAMGSIRAASEQLDMSYPRALKLLAQLDETFSAPLILRHHGGSRGGGAALTEDGAAIVQLYRALEHQARRAGTAELSEIGARLKPV